MTENLNLEMASRLIELEVEVDRTRGELANANVRVRELENDAANDAGRDVLLRAVVARLLAERAAVDDRVRLLRGRLDDLMGHGDVPGDRKAEISSTLDADSPR